MSDTINRTELAAEFDVSLPTIDNWIRRGCPVISKGDKGRAAKFSISAVRAWRAKDRANRRYNREELSGGGGLSKLLGDIVHSIMLLTLEHNQSTVRQRVQ